MSVVSELVNPDDVPLYKKVNHSVLDGLEQIEAEQDSIDETIRKRINSSLEKVETGIQNLYAKLAQKPISVINNTIEYLNNTYRNITQNLSANLAALETRYPTEQPISIDPTSPEMSPLYSPPSMIEPTTDDETKAIGTTIDPLKTSDTTLATSFDSSLTPSYTPPIVEHPIYVSDLVGTVLMPPIPSPTTPTTPPTLPLPSPPPTPSLPLPPSEPTKSFSDCCDDIAKALTKLGILIEDQQRILAVVSKCVCEKKDITTVYEQRCMEVFDLPLNDPFCDLDTFRKLVDAQMKVTPDNRVELELLKRDVFLYGVANGRTITITQPKRG